MRGSIINAAHGFALLRLRRTVSLPLRTHTHTHDTTSLKALGVLALSWCVCGCVRFQCVAAVSGFAVCGEGSMPSLSAHGDEYARQ